jgi:hypothetical protein
MPSRPSVVAGSLALLALCAGGRRADGQMRPQLSASATVLLTAQVAPRMEPTYLGIQSITADGDSATVMTRLDVGANVPHRVIARLGAAASGAVALRDAGGRWVQAGRGATVVVATAAASGNSSHLIACRVAAADAAAGCPVALEIVSADPRLPMRVSFAGRRSR